MPVEKNIVGFAEDEVVIVAAFAHKGGEKPCLIDAHTAFAELEDEVAVESVLLLDLPCHVCAGGWRCLHNGHESEAEQADPG